MVRTDIPADLIAASLRHLRVPVIRAHVYQPGYPDDYLDLGRYVSSLEITLPPNQAAGYVKLQAINPGHVLSSHALLHEDYEMVVSLGYKTAYGLSFARVGRFWLDEPQRTQDTSPPKDEMTVQARDGMKVLMETHFGTGQDLLIADVPVRDAIVTALSYVTVASQQFSVVFDTDAATTAALASSVIALTAGPLDQVNDVFSLIKEICTPARLQFWFRSDGVLRVGMMNQLAPSVLTYGGVLESRRPIFGRNHRRSGREHVNQVHVEGDQVFADVYDLATIAAIGRVKLLTIDDPEIQTEDQALIRARQELDLSARFRIQPDFVSPWVLELERRDIITIDDQGASGLPIGDYRIEDVRYSYESGSNPRAEMALGLGLPAAEGITETSGSFV